MSKLKLKLPGVQLSVPLRLLEVLDRREALFLSYLLRIRNGLKAKGQLDGGWFLCPTDSLERYLSMKPSAVSASVGRLRESGFVESERCGSPLRLWLRLRWKAIKAAVEGE
jgi:DNA-binding transcriptional ArsR family regulator